MKIHLSSLSVIACGLLLVSTVVSAGEISGTQNVNATGNSQMGSAMMGATVQQQEIGTVK